VSFEHGQVLSGRYRLDERIAFGGMGEVWRGTDQTLGRTVAVKLMRPDTAQASGFAERFRAEARHSAALSHPNIGTVYDFGEDEHTAYLVMELLEGRPLSAIIAERAPMDPAEVSAILGQAATALQAAHDSGVVHRDVKPANIMVNDHGAAKLTDFGIARAMEGSTLTQTGEVLGTPHYLSPEQAQGRPAGPTSDVYSLAVVGFEMLTGRRPFQGDSMVATALAHVTQAAPGLPESVPNPLRTTVMSSLAKDPEMRPASAAAFADALGMPAGTVPTGLAAGAAAAMAGPAGTGRPTSPATEVLPAAERTAALPAVGESDALPAAVAPGQEPVSPSEDDSGRDRRRGGLWPLLAIAAGILVIVALAIALNSANDPDSPERTPATPTTAPSSVTTEPDSTATSEPTSSEAPTSEPTTSATTEQPTTPATTEPGTETSAPPSTPPPTATNGDGSTPTPDSTSEGASQ
jgi:eukaryotic-like serine/threonine-protein kinase